MRNLRLLWFGLVLLSRLPTADFLLWALPALVCILIPYLIGGLLLVLLPYAVLLMAVPMVLELPFLHDALATVFDRRPRPGLRAAGVGGRLVGVVAGVLRTLSLAGLLAIPVFELATRPLEASVLEGWCVASPFLLVLAVRVVDLVLSVVLLPWSGRPHRVDGGAARSARTA